MMSSKSPRKYVKTMRGSPMRKEHLMKKSRMSPPMRSSGSSRPPPMKHLSTGMKRGHPGPPSSKNLHSSRIRSIVPSPHRSVPHHTMQGSPDSMDRSRSYKRSKYDKRKIPSLSPVRHQSPSPMSHVRRGPSPYPDDRYLNARSVVHSDRMDPPPPKKKIRREPDRFLRSPSPGLLRKSSNEIPFISDGGMPLRSEIISQPPMPMVSRNYLSPPPVNERVERNYHSQHSPSPMITSQSKRQLPPTKSNYEAGPIERYKNDMATASFSAGNDKKYNLTLHERFSSSEGTRTEPRIRYSREDLEKITIDIRRNIREPSPTLRQIVNPGDIKLVRRANEGDRPIFDREEIKQAPRDMREDPFFEKKTVSGDRSYQQSHSLNLRNMDNYEITRHRFDNHPPTFQTSNSRPLSDRWQGDDGRKDGATYDRDERDSEYEKRPQKKSYTEVRNRSKSGDRDFRSERYTGKNQTNDRETTHSRQDYHERRGPTISLSHEQPKPQMIRSKPAHHEIRRRLGTKESGNRGLSPPQRSSSRSHAYPVAEKRYSENYIRIEKHSDKHSPGLESHKYRPRSRSGGRDIIPEYSRKPDKYAYKSYSNKRDSSPPGPAYYQQHGRELTSPPYRGRGGTRPFRSRGFRARGFRGISRGTLRGRSSFRGTPRGSPGSRGRGAPRRGRYSPHLWEHDMYSRLSPDRK